MIVNVPVIIVPAAIVKTAVVIGEPVNVKLLYVVAFTIVVLAL